MSHRIGYVLLLLTVTSTVFANTCTSVTNEVCNSQVETHPSVFQLSGVQSSGYEFLAPVGAIQVLSDNSLGSEVQKPTETSSRPTFGTSVFVLSFVISVEALLVFIKLKVKRWDRVSN
jgi:hypothetical protein